MKMVSLYNYANRFGVSTSCSSWKQFSELTAALFLEIVKKYQKNLKGNLIEHKLSEWIFLFSEVSQQFKFHEPKLNSRKIERGFFLQSAEVAYIDDDGSVFIMGEKVA